jgi:peptidoglycan/LPS O-acetylase OafA/YrhL
MRRPQRDPDPAPRPGSPQPRVRHEPYPYEASDSLGSEPASDPFGSEPAVDSFGAEASAPTGLLHEPTHDPAARHDWHERSWDDGHDQRWQNRGSWDDADVAQRVAHPGGGEATIPVARQRQRPATHRPPADLDDAPRLPAVPGFDGLRGLALLAVLAFHQGFDVVRGGFLGISSFFTLSGFLLATLVLAEWSQTGRLALGRFWERRARRIVPAALVVLAAIVALQFTLRVGVGPGFRGDVLWSLAAATNWRFVAEGVDVAGIFIDPTPVQHLWSVAIGIQLLVVVPLAFVGMMRLAGRAWRLTGAVFALAAAGSFVLARATAAADGNGGIAFFGTHTRAGELLVGVVLAYAVLSPALRRVIGTGTGAQIVSYGAPVALLVLAWLWHATSLGDPNLFSTIVVVNSLLTAWVILAVTTPGPAASLLGAWPLRRLGTISYLAFLVHWPLYMLIDEPHVELPSLLEFPARLVATLAVAVVGTMLIERPFRTGLRMPRPQLAGALTTGAVVVVAAVLILPQQPPANVSLDIDDGRGPGALDVVAPADGAERLSIALVGDAFAASLPPGFETWNAANADAQVRVHTHVAEDCPLVTAGPVELAGMTIGEHIECIGWEPRLPKLLERAEPDVIVVVGGLGELGEREIDREQRHIGDPLYDAWLTGELEALADTLADPGVPVLWATYPHVRIAGESGDWTSHPENDPRRVDQLNELVRRTVAERSGFQVIDLMAAVQDFPGGEFSPAHRQDGTTLTPEGAGRVAAWLVSEALAATDTN